MPKIEPSNDGTFLINGKSVLRNAFTPLYTEAASEAESYIRFASVGNGIIISEGKLSQWTDENDAGFATLADFDNYVKDFFGKAPAGGGGGGDVDSVFGRTGTVTAQTGDYNVSQVTNALNKAGDTMSGNLDMGTNNIVNGGSIAITGNYTGTNFNNVPLTNSGGGNDYLANDGNYKTISSIPEAPTDDLYTRRSSGWELLKPAGESFRIGNVEGNSNFNNGSFWGVAVLLPSGTYNQMAFQVNQFNPSVGQSWQARCSVYDPITLDSVAEGTFQLDNTLVGDYPNIPLDAEFTLPRARYMYVVLGVNDNIGGGTLQGKRTTANSLNNDLISFAFNNATGALPSSLSGVTVNAENNQWFQVWFYNV